MVSVDLPDHDLVLVVDFGAQYAQLIARRVREARVYSEIVPHQAAAEQVRRRRPKAVVLSGGPQSVYVPGAPQVDPELFTQDVPVFGICYGFQAMARALGGDVAQYGQVRVRSHRASTSGAPVGPAAGAGCPSITGCG